MRRFSVGADDAPSGERVRLDQFLAASDLGLSRSALKRLIEGGHVTVNGAAARPADKLREGDQVDIIVPEATPTEIVAEDIPLSVLFEDEHLIVFDKPAGLVVHPAPGHPSGTLVNALLFRCRDLSGIGGELRPGIVHRLDKDTSGVMVASKTDDAHRGLADGFARKGEGGIERAYLAVVAPPARALSGTFDTLYGRHPVQRKKFSSEVDRGKRAVTHYKTTERFGKRAALVRCRLETGRTHQIRVHFADAGAPLVGDPLYAKRYRDEQVAALAKQLGRQALHAELLAFEHPITGEALSFRAEPAADFAELLAALRG